MHLGYLYVSAGKSLFGLKIKRDSKYKKLSDQQLVMNLPDTPSEIAIDPLNRKSMTLYSMESKGRIGRIVKYPHKQRFKHMDPVKISCNRFTFTIDPIGHVMYVLTDDRKLRLIRDIHTENAPTESTVLKVLSFFNWPNTKILFAVNTVHVVWPNKPRVMFYEVQEKRYLARSFNSMLISPPRVITVIAR